MTTVVEPEGECGECDIPPSNFSSPKYSITTTPPASSTPPHKPEETVIVFDWDDTLLCSTWLSQNGLRLDDHCPPIPPELKDLDKAICKLLRTAGTHGTVFIITNAEKDWVELSAKKFLPEAYKVLQDISICVISANYHYKPMYPNEIKKWKICAFQDFLPWTKCRHLIGMGDNPNDRNSLLTSPKCVDGCTEPLIKSIKMAERPSLEQLRRQIDMLCTSFEYIYTHDKTLDLMLTITLLVE
jgi:hypothetical protein